MRRTLANHKKQPKKINMEHVYNLLDSGKTVQEVAEEIGCSRSTLYRRHKEYQAEQAEIETRKRWYKEENPFDD